MGTVDVDGDGVTLLYGAIVLLVMSWTIFSMRVGVRVWRKAFGMDDYLMSTGIVRLIYSQQWARKLTCNTRFFSL